MRTAGSADLPLDVTAIVRVLEAHPVRVGILFGSHATGSTHPRSDVDVAVAFDDLRPGEEGYNDVFFGLSAELSLALDTDDVDLLDLHACPDSLVDRIVAEGVLLVGEPEAVRELRGELTTGPDERRPARERLDESIARIDEHLA